MSPIQHTDSCRFRIEGSRGGSGLGGRLRSARGEPAWETWESRHARCGVWGRLRLGSCPRRGRGTPPPGWAEAQTQPLRSERGAWLGAWGVRAAPHIAMIVIASGR